jgi:transposase
VDPEKWRTMERFTRTISQSFHLLETAQGVDRVGGVSNGLDSAVGNARRISGHQLGGSHRGRDVCSRKKGGKSVGNTKKGKGTKIMLMTDGEGTPLSVDITSANHAEVNLIEPLIKKRALKRKPKRLLYDRAADSDPLRKRLRVQQIELVCHHRSNRTKPPTQDGRKARRLKRRYRIERSISWLFNNRRLTVRYEHYDHLYLGFVQLACLFTILKWF